MWKEIYQLTKPYYNRYIDASKQAKSIQDILLNQIIKSNVNTSFGKKHQFRNISSYEDFIKQVTVNDYANLASYINKSLEGEQATLTDAPALLWETTSGSTSKPKYIPYTSPSLGASQKAILAWLYDLLNYYPNIMNGRSYFALSQAIPINMRAKSGAPIGNNNDAIYFGDVIGPLLFNTTIDTRHVIGITDFNEWKRITAHLLLSARDLSFISIWSPTFLIELLNEIKEIDTTFCPEKAWPRLTCISCWTSASSTLFAKQLQSKIKHCSFQGKGLLSTEAIVSFPLSQASSPVLAIESNFYEFMDENNNIFRAHEVKEGETYIVIVTTLSGLYRYNTNDKVMITGFFHNTPQLEFIGKIDSYSDLCGEKLSESFINDCFNKIGVDLDGTIFFSPKRSDKPGYVLRYDQTKYTKAKISEIVTKLEKCLSQNPHYHYARNLNQLAPISSCPSLNLLNLFYEKGIKAGKRFGDIKLSFLWHS